MPTGGTSSLGGSSAGSNLGSPSVAKVQNVMQIEDFDPTWKRWLQCLEGSFKVFKITARDEKVAYLLHYIGVEAFGILYDRLDPDDPYTKSFEDLCKKLEEFYAPEPLEIAEIFTFRKRMQKDGESAQEYMAALQKLSLHCKFGNYLKTELRNQFVFGIKFPRIQARLLETVDLMDLALKIACSMEKADQGIHQLKEDQGTGPLVAVDFIGAGVKSKKKLSEKERKKAGQPILKLEAKKTWSSKDSGSVRHNRNNVKLDKIVCYRCCKNHLAPSCSLPRSTKCLECSGLGHLRKVCKKKAQTNMRISLQ
ncbi:uncharacterized protein LOC115240424 [Formica exsecta]|uniref:uncharacterized protein LOC115240424 n=1 Tax=Formica exsecta TaxID=72781 RepID=UPI001145171E|nr:uncharacterized protein LOC115240424 [Formica exsecta]